MKNVARNNILLIIEAAIDFLDAPFFPSNDFKPAGAKYHVFPGVGTFFLGKLPAAKS